MKFQARASNIVKIKADALIVFCRENGYGKDDLLKSLDRVLGGVIKNAASSEEFTGKSNQTFILYPGKPALSARVILVGLGEDKKVNSDSFRQAAGTASRLTAVKKSKDVAFYLGQGEKDDVAQAIIEGFQLGRFNMLDYKTDNNNGKSKLATVSIYGASAGQISGFEKAIKRGEIIAESVIMARRLAMHPGNVITPNSFALEAKAAARKYGLKCTVLDEKRIKAEKMGALMAVGQGSDQPPRFIILEHRRGGTSKPVVLIGKGITFDSGGISLKPSAEMDEMKGDMTGGAVMLSVIAAAARLKLPMNIVALVPLAENMPSGRALKPGDIVKSRKGKTIEIISTDAEGRLILADALDYANKFKPQAVLDMATLTGAALYVLGHAAIPIIGNNSKLIGALWGASERTAEKVWEMPLWDEYREQIKSNIADIKNSGGRPAGTLTATAFLENFIGDWPWVHIDIAAVDLEKTGRPYIPKGATGIGVRLLIDLLMHWKKL
ncbi:putative cytosol aminopeptidase [Candidatus Zixiibacteriota bacterium]|nr:putative cytosol aminopeptidase [candidate division Zixibacteria bacterium]